MGKQTLFILLVMLSLAPATEADEQQLARFNRDYPRAAEQLLGRYTSVRGTARLWHTSPGKPRTSHPSEAAFAFDQEREKVVINTFTSE